MANDAEFTEWLSRMRENASDENVKSSIDAIQKDEKVLNYLKSGVLAHSDYTRKTTEVAKTKAELEVQVGKLRDWYAQEGPKNVELQKILAAKEEELSQIKKKFSKEFLDSDDPVTPSVDPRKYVPP